MLSTTPKLSVTLPNTSLFRPWHWLIVVVIALLLHALILLLPLNFTVPLTLNGAQHEGEQGIEIGLKKISPPAAFTQANSQQSDIVAPPVEKIQPKVIPAKPKPLKQELLKPKPRTKATSKKITTAIEPKPLTPTPIKEPIDSSTPTDATHNQNQTSQPQSNTSPSNSGDSSKNTEQSTSGGGDPKVKIAYAQRLLAHLERNKRYPSGAKRRGQEDTITLEFTIDQAGNLLSHEILTPSRYKSLNKEIERMLKKSQPFPSVPKDVQASSAGEYRFKLPIVFQLTR